MKRKFLTVLMAGVLCISVVACNKSTQDGSKQGKNETKQIDSVKGDEKEGETTDESLGVKYSFPDKWKSKKENIMGIGCSQRENIVGEFFYNFVSTETGEKLKKLDKEGEAIPETDKARMEKFQTEVMNVASEQKKICDIVTIDKNIAEGKAQKELFSKYENKDLIGKLDNYEFYLLYDSKLDTSGLSEKSKKDYEEICGEIKNLKASIKTFKPVPEKKTLSNCKKLEFKAKTLDGKEIDSSIFKDNKLTMVNIWTTFCGPCIQEMPEIQELYEEVKKDKINVIGIVADTPDEDNEALAKQILEKKGAKFTNIIPDEKIKNNVLKDVKGFPTTLFVDSEGNIVGELVVGSHDKEGYKKEIESRLKNIK
ncbi:MAG: TlpA disulfide reductase family protein [Clostridiaceae bacterium]